MGITAQQEFKGKDDEDERLDIKPKLPGVPVKHGNRLDNGNEGAGNDRQGNDEGRRKRQSGAAWFIQKQTKAFFAAVSISTLNRHECSD